MRKFITATLLVLMVAESFCLGSALRELKEARKAADNQPTPLVVNSNVPEKGYSKGVILFSGEGVSSKRYEGPMKVEIEDDVLKISCGSDVIEEFVEEEDN